MTHKVVVKEEVVIVKRQVRIINYRVSDHLQRVQCDLVTQSVITIRSLEFDENDHPC